MLRGRRDSYYAAMLTAPEVDGCCAVLGDGGSTAAIGRTIRASDRTGCGVTG
ncbi:hypothetical protein [Plantactinospora veratri]